MGRYKAAIIGCGRIGFAFDNDPKRKYISTHIGAYNFVRDSDLVAICDLNKQKLKECRNKWHILHGYTNFKEMLTKEKIDILSICTPSHTHYSIFKGAIKFPLKAIFCEKPLADNVKDAKEMLNLCKKNGIILQVDHQRRFDPLHINLRTIIKNKKLGEVQQVNFYYTAGIKNTGSHMFDLLRFFFGEAKWIEAFYSKNESGKKDDSNLDGILKFENGIFATFQACDVKKYIVFEMNCFLEQGRINLKDSGFAVDFFEVTSSKYFSGYRELYRTRAPFNTNYKRNFMVNAVKHLIDCIKKSKESISSGEDGLAALEMIEVAICSAKNKGKRVFLR